MPIEVSAKKLLTEYNQKRYREFTLNDDLDLSLPEISSVPWVGASHRHDVYEKLLSHPGLEQHVKFIKKNGKSHAFLWQTKADQLKEGVRWGIINPHSITGKVISALGNYRVVTHERAALGMVSNSQAVKLKLLDLYQDRFEALQGVESLVNKNNTPEQYQQILTNYIEILEALNEKLESYFANVDSSGFDHSSLQQIRRDIECDIERTHDYLDSLQADDNLRAYNRARGPSSILEFVKQQMVHNLYELQGINQDITYSPQRDFALTRGELNDFIEDARKTIDDHQADLHNTVTAKHHGQYSSNNTDRITYDFSMDQLSPVREREVLLAISFIEGWDTLNHEKDKSAILQNASGIEELDTITATRWLNHRNWRSLFKSVGLFLFNIVKSIFVPTNPWEEESWINPDFHLVATGLRQHARPNDPLWQKPVKFFKQIFHAFVDVFKGARDFGDRLTIRLPDDIANDWEATTAIEELNETLIDVSTELDLIKTNENERLRDILLDCGYSAEGVISKNTSKLATVEYALTPGEQNDVLTAIARGLNEFCGIFAHNIFAKDPFGGLVFSGAYATGVAAIYMPSSAAAIFGTNYVEWFSSVSYAMGSSKLGAAIAGSSAQAQLCATTWDSAIHGPSGKALTTLYHIGQDPLTVSAYFAAAYGLGYFLVNGIGGYDIPWLSEHLKTDLGTFPHTGYPIIGAKVAVMLHHGLLIERAEEESNPAVGRVQQSQELLDYSSSAQKKKIERFCLAAWLSHHVDELPKLESRQLFLLSRQIDTLFNEQESRSLHKLLYPTAHHSIAFEIFSGPLSYIPCVIRMAISLILSLVALAQDKEHPGEPIRRASIYLRDKIKNDLSRLIVFATYMLYLPYTMISSVVKITAFILTMFIGRVASLFGEAPAHFIHRGFATIHGFCRHVAELLFPVRILKDVASAHPTHTIMEVKSTYAQLITNIGQPLVTFACNDSVVEENYSSLGFSLLRPPEAKETGETPTLNDPASSFSTMEMSTTI